MTPEQQRQSEFHRTLEAARSCLGGNSRALDVLSSVTKRQTADGQWDDPITPQWNVVRTAVVLKALAKLGYTSSSGWQTPSGVGGVQASLDFLLNQFDQSDGFVGEDVWDTCQALLAVRAISSDLSSSLSYRAKGLVVDWREHWKAAEKEAWGGTAVLAALLDVAVNFDPADTWKVRSSLLETLRDQHQDGHFKSFDTNRSHSCWHTALVIRTIAKLPGAGIAFPDLTRVLTESVEWLLNTRKGGAWLVHAVIHHPMYTARSIEGLAVAREFVDPVTAGRANEAISAGLNWLAAQWSKQTELIGDLKATTCVLEMYSSITLRIPALSALQHSSGYATDNDSGADVVLVCALESPELEQALLAFGSSMSATSAFGVPFGYRGFFFRCHDGRNLKIVARAPRGMGIASTAVLTTEMIRLFHPRIVLMCGIAAGADSKVQAVGDVLVAERAFNYRSGKVFEKGKFRPDYRHIEIEGVLFEVARRMSLDRSLLDGIEKAWRARPQYRETERPPRDLKAHVGNMGSADQVVDSADVIPEIREHARKLVGIEMETYGLYAAAKDCEVLQRPLYLSCKSVCDFADNKQDDWQTYAAFTSAHFVAALLGRNRAQLFDLGTSQAR